MGGIIDFNESSSSSSSSSSRHIKSTTSRHIKSTTSSASTTDRHNFRPEMKKTPEEVPAAIVDVAATDTYIASGADADAEAAGATSPPRHPDTDRQTSDAEIRRLRDDLAAAHPDLAPCWEVTMFGMVCPTHKEVIDNPGKTPRSIYRHMRNLHGFVFKPNEPEEFAAKAQKLMDALVQQWNPMACVVGPTDGFHCRKCDGTYAKWSQHGRAKERCDVKVGEKIPFYKLDYDGTGKAVKDVRTLGDGAAAAAVTGGGVENGHSAHEDVDDRHDESAAVKKEHAVLLKKDLAQGIKVSDKEVRKRFVEMQKRVQEVVYEVKQHSNEQPAWYRRNLHVLSPLAPPDDFRDCPEAHGPIREAWRRQILRNAVAPSTYAEAEETVVADVTVVGGDQELEVESVVEDARVPHVRTRKTPPPASQERPTKVPRIANTTPNHDESSHDEDRICQVGHDPIRTIEDGKSARSGMTRNGGPEPMLDETSVVAAGLMPSQGANDGPASEPHKECDTSASSDGSASEQIPDSVVSSCAPDQRRSMPTAISSSSPVHATSMPESVTFSCAPDQLRSMPDAATSSAPDHVASMPDSMVSSGAPDELRSIPDAATSSSAPEHVGSIPDSMVSSCAPDQLRSMPNAITSSSPGHATSMPESVISSYAPDQLRSMPDAATSSSAPEHVGPIPDSVVSSCDRDQRASTNSSPVIAVSVSSQEVEGEENDESLYVNVPKPISDSVMTSEPMKAKFFSTPSLVIDGAKYGTLPAGCAVIDVRNEAACRVKLKVTLPVPEPEAELDNPVPKTTEIVIVDARSDPECLEDLVELGSMLHNFKSMSGSGEGQVGTGIEYRQFDRCDTYDPAKRPCLKQCMNSVTSRVALQMRLMCPEAWEEFNAFSTLMHGPLLGKPLSIDQKVTVAECHGEAARVDPSDKSPRYTVYTKNEACPDLKNWYLLFPTLSLGDSRGVAVQLFHGAGVSWDGRHVRHGTTIPTDLDGTPLKDQPTTEDAMMPLCTAFSVVARGDEGV
jgi:hypothetical protein